MVGDARTLPGGTVLEADVCIVGAGPSGIVLAGQLAAAGRSVVMLENGGRTEARKTQHLLGGDSVGLPYARLARACGSAFGGSSHRWGDGTGYWHALPLDAIDFEARDVVPHSGWPFARTELIPYYERAERFFGLRPFDLAAGTEELDAAAELPVRPGRLVIRQLRHGQTPFAREWERLEAAPEVNLLLHAHVAELVADARDGGAIGSVRVLAAPQRSFTVRARTTVLAAGGIGNARLLLMGNAEHPRGIGNEHDLVGRFFMEHPALRSGFVVPRDRELLRRSDLFEINETDGETYRPILAPSEDVMRERGLLNAYFQLEPRPRAFAAEGVRAASTLAAGLRYQPRMPHLAARAGRVLADAPSIARAALASRLRIENDVLVVRVQSEQVPNPDSRVTLSATRNDYGLPQAQLDWQLLPEDLTGIREAQDLLGEELEEAGLGQLEDRLGDERPPAVVRPHYHHLGTTRMHTDPAEGVVDADGRVHGVANLYVAGGSVFPTGGAANPTLTVVALAFRLAEHLAASAQRADTPAP
jgi:choline dehydrogenase-like flavoprotein